MVAERAQALAAGGRVWGLSSKASPPPYFLSYEGTSRANLGCCGCFWLTFSWTSQLQDLLGHVSFPP